MNTYTISNTKLNPNRVFILQKSELEKRLDPFYYVPELVELENAAIVRFTAASETMASMPAVCVSYDDAHFPSIAK